MNGQAFIKDSPLGGAAFGIKWPKNRENNLS